MMGSIIVPTFSALISLPSATIIVAAVSIAASSGSDDWDGVAVSADGSRVATITYGTTAGYVWTAYGPALDGSLPMRSTGGDSGAQATPASAIAAPKTGYGTPPTHNPVSIMLVGIAAITAGAGLSALYKCCKTISK